jgi:hypothetical protein
MTKYKHLMKLSLKNAYDLGKLYEQQLSRSGPNYFPPTAERQFRNLEDSTLKYMDAQARLTSPIVWFLIGVSNGIALSGILIWLS